MTAGVMKDLLVYTADADALGLMRALLKRPKAMGIRPIEFDIERHPQRDPGMVQSGAELARMKKGSYHKALLLFDFAGSGREHRMTPESLEASIQAKLDDYSWSGRSSTTVLVPEIEAWLWYCEPALVAHCGVPATEIDDWLHEYSAKSGKALETLKKDQPKELFEHLIYERLRRTISPRSFEEIGKRASIKRLLNCASFNRITACLRNWFPP
jgi:hypothetical protein